jgi:hypothetical protein
VRTRLAKEESPRAGHSSERENRLLEEGRSLDELSRKDDDLVTKDILLFEKDGHLLIKDAVLFHKEDDLRIKDVVLFH